MKSIRLKNYKCFEDTGIIDLKPLNFLVGSNSSGKSSFLEFFPLLQQSMKTNRDGSFLWVGNNVDLNDFRTVVKDGEEIITVEFDIDKIPLYSGIIRAGECYLNDVKVSIDIKEETYGDAISEIRFSFNKQNIRLKLDEQVTDEVFINGESMTYKGENIIHSFTNSLLPKLLFDDQLFETESKKGRKEIINWTSHYIKDDESLSYGAILYRFKNVIDKDLLIKRLSRHKKEDVELDNIDHIYNLALFYNINEIIDIINFYMLDFSDNTKFIQPLRASAERYYRKRNISVNKITPSGDNMAMFFLRLKREGSLNVFNDWLNVNDMGFEVDLNENGDFIQLNIVEQGKKGKNIVDVGFGYSQILPILATIWKDLYYVEIVRGRKSYCSTSIVLIEQPELHLHPRFQRKFAELLAKCVTQIKKSNKDIRFIIETHSQDILNSIGRSIAYGNLDASIVNVYMFNAQRENMEKYIEKASYSKEGFLENWPIGFFE